MAPSSFRPDAFAGKRVFITGGTQGMGLGMAHAFARHGAHVTVASRKPENLEAAKVSLAQAGYKASAVALDVRDRAAVDAAAGAAFEAGPVDVLVNNAAGNFPVPFLEMSENAWDAVVNIVLQGTANVCRSFGRRWMAQRRGATVVNVLAGYAWTGAPLVSHSGAAKAGVMNLTRSLAVEWARSGIRVNAVSPGPIADTGGAKILVENAGLAKRVLERVPMGRWGTLDEVSGAVLFLSSDAASYITGAVLVVDGGQDANSWALYPVAGPA